MKKILEINPLECPKCKADMRIVAFLTNTREINKIMKSLEVKGPEPPAKIPRSKQDDSFDPLIDITYAEF